MAKSPGCIARWRVFLVAVALLPMNGLAVFAGGVKVLVVEDPRLQWTKYEGTSKVLPGAWDRRQNRQIPALKIIMDALRKQFPSGAHFETVEGYKTATKRVKQDAANGEEGYVIIVVPSWKMTVSTRGGLEYRGTGKKAYPWFHACEMALEIRAYELTTKGKRSRRRKAYAAIARGKHDPPTPDSGHASQFSGKVAVDKALAIVMSNLRKDKKWLRFLEKLGEQ